jgi:hypothetical protein
MASSGHPLVFDARYGHLTPGRQIALWGARLTLTHPTLGEKMTFFSAPEGEAWAIYSEAIGRFPAQEPLT